MAGTGLAVQVINKFLFSVAKSSFAQHLDRVKIVSGGNGSLTAVLKLQQQDCYTTTGTLHGGFVALLVDNLSYGALSTHPTIQGLVRAGLMDEMLIGTSTDISLRFMKTIGIGEEIRIECATEKLGSKFALMTVDILDHKQSSGQIASGRHAIYLLLKTPPR